MAGSSGTNASYAYECVDKNPEVVSGAHYNKNGAVFFFILGGCTTLAHCPPYIRGAALTCVVCTR